MGSLQDIDFSAIFHQSSKDITKGHPPISNNDRDWPEAWKTIFYKSYPRLPKIPLPKTDFTADLQTALEHRHSQRSFSSAPLHLEQIGQLLLFGCGLRNGNAFRTYPSGGARFPLEVYPLVLKATAGVPPGLYHYSPKTHELDVLWERSFTLEQKRELFTYDWANEAATIFFITAIFSRTQMKYGERGYRLVLLEAGHMAQNFCLIAEALQLKCSPLAGTRDGHVEELLDIDGKTESLIYTVAFGK